LLKYLAPSLYFLSTGYTGHSCETATFTTTTTQATTIAQCFPVHNCSAHYGCSAQGEKLCRTGFTGADCETVIEGSVSDCDIFDGK